MPSTTRSSGKCNSCALCNATSSARATIWVAASQTLRRREDNCQILRFDPAILRHLGDDFRGRGPIAFDDQRGAFSESAYCKSSNSGSRRASARAGPEPSAKKACSPSSQRQPPAGILARQAGDHGIRGADHELHGHRGVAADGTEPDIAEPAHADFGYAQTRVDAAEALAASIDERFAKLAAGYSDP